MLQVLADHRGDVIRLGIGAQLVGSSTPVLFPLVLLLQALKDTADLWAEEHSRLSGTTGIGRMDRHLWEAFCKALGMSVVAEERAHQKESASILHED